MYSIKWHTQYSQLQWRKIRAIPNQQWSQAGLCARPHTLWDLLLDAPDSRLQWERRRSLPAHSIQRQAVQPGQAPSQDQGQACNHQRGPLCRWRSPGDTLWRSTSEIDWPLCACLCWVRPHYQHQKDWGDGTRNRLPSEHPHRESQTQRGRPVSVPGVNNQLKSFPRTRDQLQNRESLRSHVQAPQKGVVQQQPDGEHQDAGEQSLRLEHTPLLQWNLDNIRCPGEETE